MLVGCSAKQADANAEAAKPTQEAARQADTVKNMPMVLDFSATWCGPCRMFAPVFHAVEKDYEGTVKFLTVDIDQNSELAQQFRVEAVPTIVFLSPDGREQQRFTGAPDEATFRQAVDALLRK